MSLIMNDGSTTQSTSQSHRNVITEGSSVPENLTLRMKSISKQLTKVPEDLKKQTKLDASSLKKLFMETVDQKGESTKLSLKESSSHDFEIEGISQMTLHSFLMKAEEQGKNITYTRTLKVEIHD